MGVVQWESAMGIVKCQECSIIALKKTEFFEALNKREFSFNFITESVIKNILKLMPLNKSSCIEYLNSRIIPDGMAKILTETPFMINECIRCKVMPVKWKIGYITPLPKGKALKKPGDWRPLSVLPLPSKIIERVVYNQLVYHCECNNYLCINQHGFRKGHSTASAIFKYVQFVYDNFDCSNSTSSIFVDYNINVRILQLMQMRQYITTDTALTIYKQIIIPLFDYADFMVESASKVKIYKLEKLQEKALKCIENTCQKRVDVDLLYGKYGIQPLCLRYHEHISCLMYRQSKRAGAIDFVRPPMNLRSNKKVKFKTGMQSI